MGKGIEIEDLRVGAGDLAKRGSTVVVNYDGSLRKGDAFQRDITVTFTLGKRRVIAGLEYGVEGMRVGGERRIKIPPNLGYRSVGVPGVIPPNALLIFVVRLLQVRS